MHIWQWHDSVMLTVQTTICHMHERTLAASWNVCQTSLWKKKKKSARYRKFEFSCEINIAVTNARAIYKGHFTRAIYLKTRKLCSCNFSDSRASFPVGFGWKVYNSVQTTVDMKLFRNSISKWPLPGLCLSDTHKNTNQTWDFDSRKEWLSCSSWRSRAGRRQALRLRESRNTIFTFTGIILQWITMHNLKH